MSIPTAAEELSDAVRIAGRRLSWAIRQGRSLEALRLTRLIRRLRAALLEARLQRERLRVADRAAALRRLEIPATHAPEASPSPPGEPLDVHYVHSNFSSRAHRDVRGTAAPRPPRPKPSATTHGPP